MVVPAAVPVAVVPVAVAVPPGAAALRLLLRGLAGAASARRLPPAAAPYLVGHGIEYLRDPLRGHFLDLDSRVGAYLVVDAHERL